MAEMKTDITIGVDKEAKGVLEKMSSCHDGWKSRKYITGVSCLAGVEGIASFAWLVMDKMQAAEWVSLNQWLLPFVLGTLFVTSTAEKFSGKK